MSDPSISWRKLCAKKQAEITRLRAEVEQHKGTNREFHRRLQQAEGAATSWTTEQKYLLRIFSDANEFLLKHKPDDEQVVVFSAWERALFGLLLEDAEAGRRLKEIDIVCICGSSRFADIAAVEQWNYAKRGILALSMHLLPDWYFILEETAALPEDRGHVAEAEGVADMLDELHLRKIEMANRVLIINKDGYIGERTRFEIEYATKLGKPIEYLEALRAAEADADKEPTP